MGKLQLLLASVVLAVSVGALGTSVGAVTLLVATVAGAAVVYACFSRGISAVVSTAITMFMFYPLARTALTRVGGSWVVSLLQVGPELLIILAFLVALYHRGGIRWTAPDVAVVLYMATLFYSVPITALQGRYDLILYGFHYGLTPVLWYWVGRLVKHDSMHTGLVGLWLYVSLVMGSLGLWQYFARPGWLTELAALSMSQSIDASSVQFYDSYVRMYSILFSPNSFGMVMALASVAGFGFTVQLQGRKRIVVFITTMITFACTVLSFSRGALAAALLGVLVVALLGQSRGAYRSLALGVGSVVLLALVLWQTSGLDREYTVYRLTSIVDVQNNSAWGRTAQWGTAMAQLSESPLGVGLGQSGHAAAYHGQGIATVADAMYFKILMESGLPGIVFFVGLVGTVAFRLGRHLRQMPEGMERTVCAVALGSTVGVAVAAIGGNSFELYFAGPTVFLLMGVAITIADHWAVNYQTGALIPAMLEPSKI